MKYKVTDDFKKGAGGIMIYVIATILVFPIYHLVKGDFSWSDTCINAGLNIGTALVLGVLFFFGFQIPEKDGE